MAATYARDRIRCNVVAPGLIATPMSRRAQEDERIRSRLPELQPLTGDFGRPEDVAGAIVYLATRRSSPARCHGRRRLDRSMRHVGLDVGGTNIKLVVLEGDEVVEQGSEPTRSEEGPEAVLGRLAALARARGEDASVGVAFPGLVDRDGRGLLFPNLHGDWRGRPIREPLSRALGRPVALVNDGHAFALAEARVGAARGAQDVMCVVCGTGIGAGLVLGGRLHLGIHDRAGEIGHHTVQLDGPLCNCGNHGCLELLAGARAIARAAGRSFDDTLAAARDGDEAATAAIRRAGELIGVAVSNLTIFRAPERVGSAAASPRRRSCSWTRCARSCAAALRTSPRSSTSRSSGRRSARRPARSERRFSPPTRLLARSCGDRVEVVPHGAAQDRALRRVPGVRAAESSGSRSTARRSTRSSASAQEDGVLANPDVTVSSWKLTRSNGIVTGLPARPIIT